MFTFENYEDTFVHVSMSYATYLYLIVYEDLKHGIIDLKIG